MIHLFLIGSIFTPIYRNIEPVKVFPFDLNVANYCAKKADITSDLDFTEIQMLQFQSCYNSMIR